MKNFEAINEEQSKRIFWVIQTVFSLLLAKSLVQYKVCILDPFSSDYYLTTLGLALVYGTALWSWIDYSFSTIVSPYDFSRGKYFEKIRFFVDLLIVIAYAFLLFSLEKLQENKEANIESLLFCFSLIFLFYFLSGLLRRFRYGRHASRIKIIIAFWLIFGFLAYAYDYCYSVYPRKELLNVVFIILAIFTTILYRVLRMKYAHRKNGIAVDVDGVLADQITNLLPIIKDKYNVDLNYEDIKEWDLKITGTDTDVAEVIKEEQLHKKYVLSMQAIPGAVQAVKDLMCHFKIVIVTSRSSESDNWTKKWLDKHGIPFDAYVNMREGNKHNTDIDYEILIDDYLGNIEKYLTKSDGIAILFSQPWNHERSHLNKYIEAGRLYVFTEWEDIVAKIVELKKEL
ncbi:hypothetical protein [Gimesia sp.]|uniref:5' nucleotidase, NT5C type n=1 Tax=Gimesia sp. TaxID=2024833 RepID=UPI0032EC0951